MKKRFIAIFTLVCFTLLIPMFTFAAEKLPIGSECPPDKNDICQTGDCEESNKKGKDGKNIWYCDCSEAYILNSANCSDLYGGKPTDWTCRDGDPSTWDLDYCQHNKTNKVKFPIKPKDPSLIGGYFETSFSTPELISAVNEVNKVAGAPQPRINIPGLTFTNIDDLKKLSTIETGIDGAERVYLNIPFLGEYLATLYRYAIVVIAIIAVPTIMNQGFKYILSAGDAEKINDVKKRLAQSFIGLLIAVGSYTLLYTLNPELVKFRNLKVLYNVEEAYPEPDEESGQGNLPADGNVSKKPENISEMKKEQFGTGTKINSKWSDGWKIWNSMTTEEQGKVLPYLYVNTGECPSSQHLVSTHINHCNLAKKKLHSKVIPALKKATDLAEKEGFEICISSQYRTVTRQTQLWNTGVVARFKQGDPKYPNNNGLIARPSCKAPHNTGGAIDITMRTIKDKNVVVGYSKAQKKLITPTIPLYEKVYFKSGAPGYYRLILEEIMRQGGWVRFCKEYWHFENAVTIRYSNWDKHEKTRCNYTGKSTNWKVEIPADVKKAANALTKTKTLFKK